MASDLYVLGDADRVRARIDSFLLNGEIDQLSGFSRCLTIAVSSLAREAQLRFAADVLMAGGDDLLFRIEAKRFSQAVLAELASVFAKETACTISFGVGKDPIVAYLNLRRAKAQGGGVIVCDADRP
jgi:hypothetical protein